MELEFGVLIFVKEGKLESPEKNRRSKEENQQQTQLKNYAVSRPHWWEAGALITAPSLLLI